MGAFYPGFVSGRIRSRAPYTLKPRPRRKPACGDPGPAAVHLDDLARDKENAQRDARLDRRLGDVDPAEGCRRQRQAVRQSKRRHRDNDSAPASDEDQHPEDVQQVVEPGQDVLNAENSVRLDHFQ
jgi:hypothetical protein